MTIVADNGALYPPDVRLQGHSAESMIDLSAICRLARGLFEIPVASVCLPADQGYWIDIAADVDPDDWRFATCLEGRPDAGAPVPLIADAVQRPEFAGLPYVCGAPGMRFIASVPCGSDRLARLALFDVRPRMLTAEQHSQLDDLAALAGQSLDLARAAAEAAEREAEFRLLADTSTDTIVRGNLDGVRLYVSPSIRTLLGYEPADMVGRRAIELVHPDDIASFGELMRQIRDGKLEVGVIEVRQQHLDGSWVWMEASIRLTYDHNTGAANGYVASVRGIDGRKETEARLEHLASHDVLTGLPNRALFDQHLAAALELCQAHGEPFALLYLDIDRFKRINDTLGHPAGDAVLREAAARFQDAIRPNDVVARLGGDEFAVIQYLKAGAAEAGIVAERLIRALADPFHYEGQPVPVSLSIGVASAPEDGMQPDLLMVAADRALYEAKMAGRNTFRMSGEPK